MRARMETYSAQIASKASNNVPALTTDQLDYIIDSVIYELEYEMEDQRQVYTDKHSEVPESCCLLILK